MNTVEWILHWTVLFGPGLAAVCAGLFMYLCLNIFLWPLIALYLIYIVFWPVSDVELDLWDSVRNRVRYTVPTADYTQAFQVKGTLPARADPHLYTFHPHGLVVSSPYVHTFDAHSPLYDHLAHMNVAVHSGLFKVPFIREFMLFRGFIPSTKRHIEGCFEKGRSVCIIPGGTKEMEFSKEGVSGETWNLRSHTGFLKIAQDHQVPIVPLYSEGEQTLLTHRHHLPWLDDILAYITGYRWNIHLILQAGLPHNLRRWWSLGSDLTKKVTTVHIGAPFSAGADESVAEVKAKYIAHVATLYKSVHPDRELTIV